VSPATIPARINPTSFRDFFDHDPSQGHPLNLIQRSSILALHYEGLGDNLVAQLTGCDRSTIRRWVTHYQQHHSVGDEPRSGRPRVTSEDTDTSIVNSATETPISTPRVILSEHDTDISARTMSRRLDAVGLFVESLELTDQHTTRRLLFAQEHERWTDGQWVRILFSDKTHIYLDTQGQLWTQRSKEAAHQSQIEFNLSL
jgi:transposase